MNVRYQFEKWKALLSLGRLKTKGKHTSCIFNDPFDFSSSVLSYCYPSNENDR